MLEIFFSVFNFSGSIITIVITATKTIIIWHLNDENEKV